MESASKSTAATADAPDPNQRAAIAADSVLGRHLRRAWLLPGTRIADVAWPVGSLPMDLIRSRFGMWHYWWQAHLVDVLVDAAIHRPAGTLADGGSQPPRAGIAELVQDLLRGIRIRNLGKWTNNYYDDMAWLGLAIERADRHLGLHHPRALAALAGRMRRAWEPERGGGIPWRTIDTFFNAPANGPAAILLARTGDTRRALAMSDWMDRTLIDPDSHLVIDGVKPTRTPGEMERVTAIYTYCQGVVLGAEVEALRLTRDVIHLDRIDRLLTAVAEHECPGGVIRGAGGGDGGLFMGILARYLAVVATDVPTQLPGVDVSRLDDIRRRAGDLVTSSADAAWRTRAVIGGSGKHRDRVVFSADWHRQATVPSNRDKDAAFVEGAVHSSETPERDLSVQLSGWMVQEAAAAVDLRRREHASK